LCVIMAKTDRFSFTGAKQESQSQEPISLRELSLELKCSEDQTRLLAKHGWLTVIREHEMPQLFLVGKPKPAAMTWLRQTTGMIPMIPMIPVRHVAELLATRGVKTLLLEHGIQVYVDAALGELITVASFHRLFNLIYPWHLRSRYDRQMLLAVLTGIDAGSGSAFVKPKPYDQKLEDEIRRVARLPQPQRSIRGMEIYDAYKDAKTIASVVRTTVKTPLQRRVERIMAIHKAKMDRDNAIA
jgi:hypothetical protein